MKHLRLLALLALIAASAVNTNTAAAYQLNPTRAHAFTDGRTFTHKEGGIQFDLPEDWHAEPDGDTLTVSAPDNSLKMIFFVAKHETFEATVKEIGDVLDKLMKNVKEDGPGKEDELNGIKTFSETGIGEVNGAQIKWSVDLLAAKKPVIIVSFAAPGVWEKHIDGYANLLKSIKKV
ncbi:MAG: hypothetical protein NVSMB56_15590 [Pyrinomonadaceae bacterium]